MSDDPSSRASASGSSSAKGAGSSTSSNAYLRSRFSLRGILFSIAALIFVTSTIIAYTQDPRPDPFTPASTFDWVRYPLEYNAFRRLPVISGTINAVFAVKSTKHVWAAGNNGLILHSSDGGKSWAQQQISPPRPAVAALADPWRLHLVPTAWAQSEKSVKEELKASETLQIDPKSKQNPAEQKPTLDSPSRLGVSDDVAPSADNPPTSLGKFPIEFKDTTKSPQRVRESPQTKTPPTKSPEKGSGGTGSQPTPATLANLSGLFFVDQLTGWAVGDGGTILHTTDGGKTWNTQSSKSSSVLFSVAFVDAKNGWAVGDRGTILHTSDGGQSWIPQSSKVALLLRSVAFVDAKNGWAVGESGTILHTSDGGQSWNSQSSKHSNQLLSITFVNANTGWVVGDNGIIIHTTDAGQNWNPQSSKVAVSLSSVVFVDANNGWALGWNGIILHTSNRGQSWNAQTSKSRESLVSVTFVDANTGWAAGGDGTILHTTDRGQSWNAQTSKSRESLVSVTFVDANTGWAAGGDGTILHTRDSGQNWHPQSSKTKYQLSSVVFSDPKIGWAVGDNGIILNTTEGGETWNQQSSNVTDDLSSAAFVNAKNGWAIGIVKGTILHTTDGGETWNSHIPPSIKDRGFLTFLSSVAFVDAKTGWAVGWNGIILHTSDGGETWNSQTIGFFINLHSVAVVDAKTAWAVGIGGFILHTTDGGQKWNWQPSGTKNSLYSVRFANANMGWAVGESGTILHTTDGGQNWSPQSSKVSLPLRSIAFVGAKNGWAVGDGGIILHTTDGGQSWNSPQYRRNFAPWYYGSLVFVMFLLAPALRKPPPKNQSVPSIEAAMASDRPLRSGELDVLNLAQIAFALSRFLRNENTQPPLTIAITGDWGTGKSSLMNLLRDDLAAYGVRPVWFNAWHHQKEEHLLASLLSAVRAQAIPRFLTLAGLKFRVKLAWGRIRSYPITSAILGALFFIAAGYLLWDFPKRPLALWNLLSNLNVTGDNWSFDSVIKALLGSAVLAPAYGLYKILQPFGINPAVLLQNMSQGFTRRAAAQKTGFREEFARDFKEVSEALNPRTMLILIDDLDRCRPDAILEVMEGINFLISSGDCFVVMGMAREKVERAVGLSFKDIAKELVGEQYREAKPEEKEDHERHQRWEYGKRYLEKLVNLSVQVPLLTPTSGATLLARATTQNKNDANVWRFVKDFSLTSVSVLVIAGLFYVGGKKLPEVPVPPPSSDAAKKVLDTQAPPKSTKPTPPILKPPLISPTPKPEEILGPTFLPGEKDSPGIWWVIAGVLVLIVAGSALVLVRPPIVVPDSKNFIDALEIWDDVIINVHSTPRTLKRFMNNLRWLAARTRQGGPPPKFTERLKVAGRNIIGRRQTEEPGEIPEPVLVGLAALEAVGFKSAPGNIHLFLHSNKGPVNGNAADAYEKHRATAETDKLFGNWPPTSGQITRFFELLGDSNLPTTPTTINDDGPSATRTAWQGLVSSIRSTFSGIFPSIRE